jgi:hypothetical protein
MEPFFMFCAGLVIYCGYLTLVDLLKTRKTVIAPAPSARRMAGRAGKTGTVRRRVSSVHGQAGAAVGHYPSLSKGSA